MKSYVKEQVYKRKKNCSVQNFNFKCCRKMNAEKSK